MTDNFDEAVQKLAEKAHRAVAHARDTKALVDRGLGEIQACGAQILQEGKATFMTRWLKVVEGTVLGPTLLGGDTAGDKNYSTLFDALVAAIASNADPPNDAELITCCTRLMPPDAASCTNEIMKNTFQAIELFEEVASSVVQDEIAHEMPGFLLESQGHAHKRYVLTHSCHFVDDMKAIVCHTVLRAQHCFNKARKRTYGGECSTHTNLADARLAFAEAKEILLETLHTVHSRLPKAAVFGDDGDDIEAVKKLTIAAEGLEKMAEKMRALADTAGQEAFLLDREAHERRLLDTRVGLVRLLNQKFAELSDRWVERISQSVAAYKERTVASRSHLA